MAKEALREDKNPLPPSLPHPSARIRAVSSSTSPQTATQAAGNGGGLVVPRAAMGRRFRRRSAGLSLQRTHGPDRSPPVFAAFRIGEG
ncbi:MAG: hypothetical protein LBD78_03670 [Spirochaetaceae bacterium]|nr:hypothetical protein [Spirochaetaceae bacterium]